MTQVDQADRALMDNKQPVAHTPGPWTLDPIAGAAGNYYIYSDADHGALIAKVDCRECGTEQAEANAKLIASAPDLVEALQDLMVNCAPVTTSEGGLALTDFFRVWFKAQEVLIKARGRL